MIKFLIKLFCSFGFGIVANKFFSSSRIIEDSNKEMLYTYEIPFIYTLTLLDLILIPLVTLLILITIRELFEGERSKQDITKISKNILKIEVLVSFFILGTQFQKISLIDPKTITDFESLKNLFSYYYLIPIFFWGFISLYEEKIEKLEIEDEIYESRKFLLDVIENNLKNMEAFSIIGDWGIGKSVLVKNFFYKNKKEYELIFIDSSIYSSNEKMVAVLEDEIIKLLKKYNIFIRNKNIEEEIFIQSNNMIEKIYNFFYQKTTVNEYRKEIKEKIDFIINKSEEINGFNKIVVICLDNLERLGSKERIKNLFAIVNELFPENIKKIYIYDEKEMERLFNLNNNFERNDKKSNEFINYIEKYTFNKIEITQTPFEEILNAALIKNFRNDNNFSNFIKEFFEDINRKIFKSIMEAEELKENCFKIYNYIYGNSKVISLEEKLLLNKKLLNISNGIKNPRYLNNLLSDIKKYFIQNINDNKIMLLNNTQKKIIKYKLEYRIIRDFLINIEKENIAINKNTYFDVLNGVIDINNDDNKTENLCLILLFGLDILFKENIDNIRRRIYYEHFFDNSNPIKIEDSINKKLIDLKKYPNKNLLEIIEYIMSIYPENYICEIKNFLKEVNFEYIINSENEAKKLIFLSNFEEYFYEILKKIKFIENNTTFNFNVYTNILISYIDSKKEIKYLMELVQSHKKNFNTISEKIFYLSQELEKNKKFLKDIMIFEKLNKIFKLLNFLVKIKIEKNNIKNINIKNIAGFYISESNFLCSIKIEKDEMIININKDNEIHLSKKDILKLEKKYLNILSKIISKEDSENKILLSRIRIFLIEIEKFKNQI